MITAYLIYCEKDNNVFLKFNKTLTLLIVGKAWSCVDSDSVHKVDICEEVRSGVDIIS